MSNANPHRPSKIALTILALGLAVDAAVGVVSPRRAASRMRDRLRLSAYEAAIKSSKTRDWRTHHGLPDDMDLLGNAVEIIADRARESERNNPHAASLVAAFSRNCVGTGITPTSAHPTNQAFNRQLDNLFWDWASDPELVDVEGRKSFFTIQQQVLEGMIVAGEIFVVDSVARDDQGKIHLQLQVVEPESLATALLTNPENGNRIVRGIEINNKGKAVAYWFNEYPDQFMGTVGHNVMGTPKRHERARVCHIYWQKRPKQTHGVSWLAPVLRKLRDLVTFDYYQLVAAKIEAAIAIIIQREQAQTDGVNIIKPPAGAGDPAKDSGGASYSDLDGGLIFEGAPGDKVTGLKPERPGNAYTPFMQQQLRSIAAGARQSYEVIARDYTQGSYGSLRQSLTEDRREYKRIQQLLIEQFCQPIRKKFINLAVLNGDLAVGTDFFIARKAYEYTKWRAPGFDWISPKDEVEAFSKAIEMGIITREQVCAEKGEDWREVFNQRAVESAEAARLQLMLPEEADRFGLKAELIKTAAANAITSPLVINATDLAGLLKQSGVPVQSNFEQPELTPGATGEAAPTIAPAGDVTPPQPPTQTVMPAQ